MSLLVIGINHKTTPVRVREKFSFTRKLIRESLLKFKDSGFVSGTIILSTCNRTEIYLDIKEDSPASIVRGLAFAIFGAGISEIERYFYTLQDLAAVRHLFRVASGLDSQVLGENQILAQVESAWVVSKEIGTSSDKLDNIFKRAEEAGRIVRQETRISQGNISIGSIAIKMLKSRLGFLQGLSALIIGAGKIGALISNYLKDEDIQGIFVASRTYERALKIASSCGGRTADFSNLEEELKGVDIVISSTSSPHIILKKEMLIKVMAERKKPLFIMDLALPRDVEPEVRDIEGVFLYDLDDLKCVVEENYKGRELEAASAERIVEREVEVLLKQEMYANCPGRGVR